MSRHLALFLFLFWLSPTPQSGGPGGRQIRLEDSVAGPYLLRALTSPIPPTVGELFIEVRVTDRATGQVLENLLVEILASPLEGDGQEIYAVARGDIAPTPREYAALLQLPESGFWRVIVRVDGPGGSGEAEFIERVVPRAHWIHILFLGAPLAGLLAILSIYAKSKRDTALPSAASPHAPTTP